MSKNVVVQDLKFALIYVDELEPCQAFYETYFGFVQTAEFRPGEIYGTMGNVDLWIGSGYKAANSDENNTRATVMIGVDSVGKLYRSLKADNQKIVQDEPIEMQPGAFWLQVVDPAGNVLDILGAE
ncbi:VOC family protein [Candidatus Leptofilum sp.]|uniref:VOC family protein n=1 Tax=Candidatus Leptofilum sp. TaxID=3241576 RepID=UPI003B5C8709